MTKFSSRNGCLTQRRQCPCGIETCFVRIEGDEEDLSPESLIEARIPHGPFKISLERSSVDSSPYVGQSFRTDDEAQNYYTNFARKNGFAIRRERSKGNPTHPLGVYKRELVCHRAGQSLPRKTAELKRQRNKKSSRCKCEAQMIIKKNVSKGVSRWVVIQFSNVHNHELLDSEEVRHLPAYRNISSVDRENILSLAKRGFTVNHIMKALETEKGVKAGHLTFTERDLRNFLQASKNINKENEGTELLKACKAMKDKRPDFRFEFTLDDSDCVEHIAWSYPESFQAYRLFGDIVIFDTSYNLYEYDRLFGVWFGLDNYGNVIFFGCVLLQDAKPHSHRWALQSFVRLMEGKFPRTVLTDLDMGLKDAMMSELPSTKHVFAIWHLTSKLSSWFSTLPGSQFENFVSDMLRVCNLDSVVEFDHQWNQMVLDFGLDSDRHIAILSFHREYWALPYLRGCFLGGLMRSGRPTSVKSFFKGPLNSQTRLRDFFERVGTAIDFLNQAGEEATLRQNYQNIKTRTCMPLEEQALHILTPYAFDMFQREIVESMQFAVYETERESYLVRHRLMIEGGHFVRCIQPDDEIQCSCQEFESSGILCRHILRVLSLKNYFMLPDRYLLIRWRRESSLFPKSSGYKFRSQALRSLASIVIQESSLTKDRFDYAQWHMSKLLTHVREMPTTVDETTADVEPSSLYDAAAANLVSQQTTARTRHKKLKNVAQAEAEVNLDVAES
ncbi:protein FAR1-RELATED SEQUENCE 11-like isoform X2 [Phalaenopsis equestris]|nr:protein FAR1-RELATED SEQUENCE 11-like isoform X2 [Phalaenopsis equestris]XP_020590355.1 protein FAR1-RELATED SEQUENCE 11-like isoform X2 [Phalaenopsis equestris]